MIEGDRLGWVTGGVGRLMRGLGCTCLEKEAKVLSTLCTAEGNDERKTTVCVCGVCGVCGVRCEVWEASVSE